MHVPKQPIVNHKLEMLKVVLMMDFPFAYLGLLAAPLSKKVKLCSSMEEHAG